MMIQTTQPDFDFHALKLIVSDLDGTLKDIDAPMDPALREIIAALSHAGVLFTIATGKNLKSTRESALALGISMPLIFSNGCIIQEIDGTVIEERLLPRTFTDLLIGVCAQEGIELAIHIGDDIYVREITENVSILFEYGSPDLVEVGEWERVNQLLAHAHKCIAIDRENRQRLFGLEKRIQSLAGATVEYCHTLVEMLEFMPQGVSKVSGIRSLAAAHGISMGSILTMGDGNNDIGMLQEAGFGVAVANAPQAVQDAADWVVPACAQNGPRDFLRHILSVVHPV
jgi:hypothetical protein